MTLTIRAVNELCEVSQLTALLTMTRCPQSVVSYRCNHGYLLHGPGTRSCAADQRWSGEQPECREINCGLPGPAGDGVIPNG